ncbi:MAG: redoxin family protein, partial [Bacteroidota bacterium]
LFLTSILTPVFSQESYTLKNDKYPKVSGQLIGYDLIEDAELELKFYATVPTAESQELTTIKPNKDGSFEWKARIPMRYQQIIFRIDELYHGILLVDSDLTVNVDLQALKKEAAKYFTPILSYGGSDGELTAFVNKYTSFEIPHRKKAPNYTRDIRMNNSLSIEQKLEKLYEVNNYYLKVIDEFVNENPSPYAWILKNEQLSKHYKEITANYLLREIPPSLFQEIVEHTPMITSNSMHAYHVHLYIYSYNFKSDEKINFLKSDLLTVLSEESERIRLLALIDQYKKQEKGESVDSKKITAEYVHFYRTYQEHFTNKFTSLVIKNTESLPAEKGDLAKLFFISSDIKERDSYVTAILPTIKTEWCKELAQSEWQRTKDKLKEVNEKLAKIEQVQSTDILGERIGTYKDGSELVLAKQDNIEAFLAGLKAKFPNKAILIDIWATWCGPCISDMKRSTVNIQKLRGMDIEVVYVCVANGSNQEKWEKKVAEFDHNTQHIFLSKTLSNQIMDYFSFTGYPSHVFLDKKGKYHKDLVHSVSNLKFEAIQKVMK